MGKTLLAILLAFLGYSFLNLGQAGQKIGLDKRHKHPLAGWAIWGVSTAATGISFFLILASIFLGSLRISGAMAGTGLVSLAVFSKVVLKEELKPLTLVAVFAIVIAAVIIGIFNENSDSALRSAWLYGLLGGGIAVYLTTILLVPTGSLRGVFIGGLAGFLGAYSQIFQRYGTENISFNSVPIDMFKQLISDPITLIWIGLSLISMLVLQFSYRYAQTIQIVPVFTSNFIAVPVLGGVIVFGEMLTIPQWIAVIIMISGSVVLGRRTDSEPSAENY